jgi:hypothetical protein
LSCEPLEDAPCRDAVSIVNVFERLSDCGLYSALPNGIDPGAPRGQAEHRPPAISRIGGSDQQSLCDQSLEHASERAGMDVQHRRQIAG